MFKEFNFMFIYHSTTTNSSADVLQLEHSVWSPANSMIPHIGQMKTNLFSFVTSPPY